MAHGLPALWNFLISVPFLGIGLHLIYTPIQEVRFPEYTLTHSHVEMIGYALATFGAFILLAGLYIQFVSIKIPKLREGEEIIDQRHPTFQVALGEGMTGGLMLAVTAYLLFFFVVPFIIPTITFLVGFFFFTSGLRKYWANCVTQYFVTNQRVLSEYRLIRLRRKEIPLDKVRSVQQGRSFFEATLGLGHILVASAGGSSAVELRTRHHRRPTEFADQIRDLI